MSSHHLSGLTAWLVQRLSAVYMALFILAVVGAVFFGHDIDYHSWRGLFMNPMIAITTTMFFLALLLHTWVGIRDVILDYAGQSPPMRLLLLSLLVVLLDVAANLVKWVVLKVIVPDVSESHSTIKLSLSIPSNLHLPSSSS